MRAPRRPRTHRPPPWTHEGPRLGCRAFQPGTSGGRPIPARQLRRTYRRSIQSRQQHLLGPPQGTEGRGNDLPNAAGCPSQDAGRMAHDEPLASRGDGTPFLPPPEAQSVDLRGFMPPRSSGEALPAGRKVPPAGLAALPAAPLESQGWGAGERWTRGRAVRLPFGGTAGGCAPRLRRAPGPPPLRPAPPVVRALPAGGPTADGALCRWGALPSRRATDRQPPALATTRGSAAGGTGPEQRRGLPARGAWGPLAMRTPP